MAGGLDEIPGQPLLYRSHDTGQIYNMREFHGWETTAPFQRNGCSLHQLKPEKGEAWILCQWAVVLHPWHEVIAPSLTVDLIVNDFTFIQGVPLFRVAEPLKRSADCELERRIAKIEKALNLTGEASNQSGKLVNVQLFNQCHEIKARIQGPPDDLGHIMEMTKHCLLRLQGLRRQVVY